MDGVSLMKRLREWSAVPVIVVSARGKEQDKIVALDAGADDYLTKPFSVGELLARVRVALRHAATVHADSGDPVFITGDLRVDLLHRRVTAGEKDVHLTPNEFKLLTMLVKHAGMVLTHRQLLKEVWGPGTGHETHYVRVYMNQLPLQNRTQYRIPAQAKIFSPSRGLVIDCRRNRLAIPHVPLNGRARLLPKPRFSMRIRLGGSLALPTDVGLPRGLSCFVIASNNIASPGVLH